MRAAVVYITSPGRRVAERVAEVLRGEGWEVVVRRGRAPLRELLGELAGECDALVCVMALGIVVRTLAPLLVSKHTDPAVVCVDDAGRFAVSVASGHRGANRLAELLASGIGAIPVVTTSTSAQGLECAEDFAAVNGLEIEGDTLGVNSAIANHRRVAVFSDIPVETSLRVYPLEMLGKVECEAGVVVTARVVEVPRGWVVMRPKCLAVGIGAKRGVEAGQVLAAIGECLDRARLSSVSISGIFTIPRKAAEAGLREAAERLGVEVHEVELSRVREVEHMFRCSEFVRQATGAGAVAEPCAYLGSGGGRLVGTCRGRGVKVAVAEQTFIFQ